MKETDPLNGWENEGGHPAREAAAAAQAAAQEENKDPLHPQNAPTVQTILLMRIYDLLFAIHTHQNPQSAQALYNLHANGGIATPAPSYNPDTHP